jgi:hypothetical protein
VSFYFLFHIHFDEQRCRYNSEDKVNLPATVLRWMAFDCPFPLYRRDFVVVETVREIEEGVVVSCGAIIFSFQF